LVYFGFVVVEELREVPRAPSEVIVQEKAVSYADQLKARITEINGQLEQLDSDFRSEKMDGDEYTTKRQSLKQVKNSLREELVRMGVVT
jgi:hypothetical protein